MVNKMNYTLEKNIEEKRRDFFYIISLYLMTHMPILLLSNAIYWDDWVIFAGSPDLIIKIFREQSATLFRIEGYIHIFILETFGAWVYRLLTLILMGLAGFYLYKILERNYEVSREVRFFAVVFFLILPFNFARIEIVNFRYIFCYFLFFLGWFLFDKQKSLSLICFFMSFNTQSLLVFYALPVYEIYHRRGKKINIPEIAKFILEAPLLFALPFLYFIIKINYFSASGDYIEYNVNYKFSNIIQTPINQLINFLSLKVGIIDIIWISLFSMLSLKFIKSHIINFSIKENPIEAKAIIFIGLLSIICASFPYWILGLTPTFNEWSSRHQLLLPLGFSLLIIGTVISIKKSNFKIYLITIVIGASIYLNVSTYLDLFVDWRKQKNIIELIKNNELIYNSELVFFEDKTIDLNAINRIYRPYEWSGIMALAFGDRCRKGFTLVLENSISEIVKPDLTIQSCHDTYRPTKAIKVVIEKRQGRIKTWLSLISNSSDAFVLKVTHFKGGIQNSLSE